MLGGIGLFQQLNAKLSHGAERMRLVSENIANADTPGYEAKDLQPFDLAALTRATPRLAPAATSPAHLTGTLRETLSFPMQEPRQAKPYGESPDHNTVDLEQEMLKAAQIQGAHNQSLTLFSKHVAILRTAIGGRG